MAQITQEMLRKRAEHNEGILTTLEEVYLKCYKNRFLYINLILKKLKI